MKENPRLKNQEQEGKRLEQQLEMFNGS